MLLVIYSISNPILSINAARKYHTIKRKKITFILSSIKEQYKIEVYYFVEQFGAFSK